METTTAATAPVHNTSTEYETVWSRYGRSDVADDLPLSRHWQTGEVGYWRAYAVNRIVRFDDRPAAAAAAAKFGAHRDGATAYATTYPFYAHEIAE